MLNPSLVVYDPSGRYESAFDKLGSENCEAIKATGSTIQSRLDAEKALLELAKANPKKPASDLRAA